MLLSLLLSLFVAHAQVRTDVVLSDFTLHCMNAGQFPDPQNSTSLITSFMQFCNSPGMTPSPWDDGPVVMSLYATYIKRSNAYGKRIVSDINIKCWPDTVNGPCPPNWSQNGVIQPLYHTNARGGTGESESFETGECQICVHYATCDENCPGAIQTVLCNSWDSSGQGHNSYDNMPYFFQQSSAGEAQAECFQNGMANTIQYASHGWGLYWQKVDSCSDPCTKIVLQDLVPVGDVESQEQTAEDLYSSYTICNCNGNTPLTVQQNLGDNYELSQSSSYSTGESWTDTFSTQLSTSVEISAKEGIGIDEAGESLTTTVSTDYGFDQTVESSSTSTQALTYEVDASIIATISANPGHNTIASTVFQSYEYKTKFTATLICEDANGNQMQTINDQDMIVSGVVQVNNGITTQCDLPSCDTNCTKESSVTIVCPTTSPTVSALTSTLSTSNCNGDKNVSQLTLKMTSNCQTHPANKKHKVKLSCQYNPVGKHQFSYREYSNWKCNGPANKAFVWKHQSCGYSHFSKDGLKGVKGKMLEVTDDMVRKLCSPQRCSKTDDCGKDSGLYCIQSKPLDSSGKFCVPCESATSKENCPMVTCWWIEDEGLCITVQPYEDVAYEDNRYTDADGCQA